MRFNEHQVTNLLADIEHALHNGGRYEPEKYPWRCVYAYPRIRIRAWVPPGKALISPTSKPTHLRFEIFVGDGDPDSHETKDQLSVVYLPLLVNTVDSPHPSILRHLLSLKFLVTASRPTKYKIPEPPVIGMGEKENDDK